MCEAKDKQAAGSSVNVADDREACPKVWYVAYTRVNYERKAQEYLCKLGYEVYVPVQKEVRQWSDRRKVMDRIVIPMAIFICTAESKVREVEHLSFITHLLRVPGQKKMAAIPDEQIVQFRYMLEHADSPVQLENVSVNVGSKVRVIKGKLKGLEGIVSRCKDGRTNVSIVLDYLGCASVSIEKSDLEIINTI